MKTALLLSLVCAAAILSGCSSTNQGAAEDTYNTQSGSTSVGQPAVMNPSPTKGTGEAGPQVPPP